MHTPLRTRGEAAEGGLDELARIAREGDPEAFRELVRATHRLIYRWALVRVGDPDDADDVTQSVLIRLHGSLQRWEGRGSFTAWLYRVTANESSSWRRALARRRRKTEAIRLHVEVEEGASGRSRPAVEGAARRGSGAASRRAAGAEGEPLGELEAVVLEEFGGLPARQRQVFDLVDLQGHEPLEVAEMLNMNPNTVRANLFKARRSLRKRILAGHPHLGKSHD